MLFYTQAYLVFFFVVFVCYWTLPWQRASIWLLLAASIFFYAKWSEWLALLVTCTTVMDYLLARGLDRASSRNCRHFLLGASLTVNLGLLCYFKYANFFLDALRESLARFGVSSNMPLLEVIVPFGISFYTFEAISYTMDVYRRKFAPRKACRTSCSSSCSFPISWRGLSSAPETFCLRQLGPSASVG